jgi:hypothetical protein
MAALGTNSGAGHAADAVHGILDGHHHHFIVVIEKIVIARQFRAAFDKLENIAGTDFVTATAADAFFGVEGGDEFGSPLAAPSGKAGDCGTCHGLLLKQEIGD